MSKTLLVVGVVASVAALIKVDESLARGTALDIGPERGETAYEFSCLAWGLAGQFDVTDIQACGELPYNAEVNREIQKRVRLRSDMGGSGVLEPLKPINPMTPQSELIKILQEREVQ